jgi:hypothetical protein
MKDDSLLHFFAVYVAKFYDVESLTRAVTEVRDITTLEDRYRLLVIRLIKEWTEIDGKYQNNEKVLKNNPATRADFPPFVVLFGTFRLAESKQSRLPPCEQPQFRGDPRCGIENPL